MSDTATTATTGMALVSGEAAGVTGDTEHPVLQDWDGTYPVTVGRMLVTDAYGPRPVLRGRLHFFAAVAAVPATLVLLAVSSGATARAAVAIYGATLIGLFAVSASYHRLARTPTSVKWFRRADHSMIFLLIAGTYTPICLLALPPSWGITTLAIVWVTALVGVGIKMARLGNGSGSSGSWLYIVLGWAGLLTAPLLVTHLSATQLVLLAVGGVLYTAGAVVLGRRRPDPVPHVFGYHEVWHTMTIAAGGCHFAAVLLMLG